MANISIEKKLHYATEIAKVLADPNEPSPELIAQFVVSLQMEELIRLINKQSGEIKDELDNVVQNVDDVRRAINRLKNN